MTPEITLLVVASALVGSTIWPYRKPAIFVAAATILVVLWGFSPESLITMEIMESLLIVFSLLVLSGLLRYSEFFSFITKGVLSRARSEVAAFLLLNLVAALMSSLAATSLVLLYMVTISINIAREYGLNPKPLLISMIVSSNIASISTMVGDISNVIIATCRGFSYDEFLVRMVPMALPMLMGALIVQYLILRGELRGELEVRPHQVTVDRSYLHYATASLLLMFFLSLLSDYMGIAESSVMGVVAIAVLFIGGERMKEVYEKVRWEILLYIGALLITAKAFGLSSAPSLIASIQQVSPLHIFLASLGLSAFIDGAETAAISLPVLGRLAVNEEVWWSMVVGTSLGSAISPFGSIANLLALRRARRMGIDVSYREYLRISVPSVAAASLIYLLGGVL